MNTHRLREDILANLDKLPERFADSGFYNPKTDCFCFYGWLAQVVGSVPVKTLDGDTQPIWSWLDRRYEHFASGETIAADKIIRAATGHPQTVVNLILARFQELANV